MSFGYLKRKKKCLILLSKQQSFILGRYYLVIATQDTTSYTEWKRLTMEITQNKNNINVDL